VRGTVIRVRAAFGRIYVFIDGGSGGRAQYMHICGSTLGTSTSVPVLCTRLSGAAHDRSSTCGPLITVRHVEVRLALQRNLGLARCPCFLVMQQDAALLGTAT
jgi:hypothetical protein